MCEGYPRRLGDIGGTHARWAWLPHRGAALEDVVIVADASSASLYDSAVAYLERGGQVGPRWAGIGIATAVTGDGETAVADAAIGLLGPGTGLSVSPA